MRCRWFAAFCAILSLAGCTGDPQVLFDLREEMNGTPEFIRYYGDYKDPAQSPYKPHAGNPAESDAATTPPAQPPVPATEP